MNSSELLVNHATMAEVLSERGEGETNSNSSTSSTSTSSTHSTNSNSSCSTSGHSGSLMHMPIFNACKNFEDLISVGQSDEVAMVGERLADGPEMPIALDKPKDYAVQKNEVQKVASADEPRVVTHTDTKAKEMDGPKEAMSSFYRDIRQKSLHAVLERTAASGKDLELIKNYASPLERMKNFSGFTSRIGNIAIDRLRSVSLHGVENLSNLEPKELKNMQELPSRAHVPAQVDATMAFERLRHAHSLFQDTASNDISQLTEQFSHSHQHQHQQQSKHHHCQHHHEITQITQMQQNNTQQHQNPPKSFTIDAILGLRGSSQRDKHQRHHTYRKYEGQEIMAKNLTTSTCANGTNSGNNVSGTSGKLKRVRTIFTAEQLERLEGEFARQQYMVGPERLYLAHALRLTEAQVKVWFQNRRIKWRKLNHEKQSQRLYELHQSDMSTIEHEDSNENTIEW